MRIGDLVKLHTSTRRNGKYAGKTGLVIDLDVWENPTLNVRGRIKSFHYSQIAEVISESR